MRAERGGGTVGDVPLDPSIYEKLGAFFLGRPYDLAARKGADEPLLYDSRDLTTHAVCVGMTGSGKTGLCLSLLEEAAIDGIPAILIDPKGDLGNLLLTFPELRPEDFRPWINEEDARRKGLSPEAYAEQQAELWRKGLASWGEGPERIKTLRDKVDLAIYTPGSSAGIPVNILTSFNAPKTDDAEALADRVQTAVASLLGLVKIDADPVKSREFIFLSALISHEWTAGRDLDLGGIIEGIQHPPIEKIGVLDLETFYPAKDRFALVMALNNLLASPGFSSWQQGEPLDAAKFLHTPEGRPRLAIFSIAHLGDEERMFFVSLLLNEVLSWTRAQSGTTSLRAILYMDEIFGYLPPTANPASKQPMMLLLKQARAFGVGVVLATQNPVDLDYKALSNAGTWFIGRLQTERDKARVLDGLQGAAAGGKFDRAAMESALAGLGSRVFLMNNVHDDGPVIFETRWTLSYLAGPLTKERIKLLMNGRGEAAPAPVAKPAEKAASAQRPALPPEIKQVFLPGSSANYEPRLLGAATVRFSDAKTGIDTTKEVLLSASIEDGITAVSWESAESLAIPLAKLEKAPAAGATFAGLPSAAANPKNFSAWEKEFLQALSATQRMTVYRCAEVKEISKPEETMGEFRARIDQKFRERRDEKVDAIRKKYAPKLAALGVRESRAKAAVEREKEQASHARMQTFISLGSTILGAVMGRKINATTINRAATTARGVGRSFKEGADVGNAEQSAEAIRQQIEEMNMECEAEVAASGVAEPEIDSFEIKPARSGTTVRLLALAWQPV